MLLRRTMISFVVMICASGCASNGRIDVLEARLREQEIVVDRYERQIADVNSQLSMATRRARMLEQKLAGASEAVSSEATEKIAAVEGVKFNTLLTAAQDQDDTPGDDKIHAMVYPHDANGDLVKLVGKVIFEAIDLSLPEGSRTVGRWEMDPDSALETWHDGFLSSGYKFEFPWQKRPAGKEVLLHVKLEAPDGREFTAQHTVAIDPPQLLAVAPDVLDLKSSPNAVELSSANIPAGEKETANSDPIQTSDNWNVEMIPFQR